jgi:hypothetical protein
VKHRVDAARDIVAELRIAHVACHHLDLVKAGYVIKPPPMS